LGPVETKLETFVILVINIDGRQFLFGEDYVDGKSLPLIRVMKKPVSFASK